MKDINCPKCYNEKRIKTSEQETEGVCQKHIPKLIPTNLSKIGNKRSSRERKRVTKLQPTLSVECVIPHACMQSTHKNMYLYLLMKNNIERKSHE